MATDIAVHDEGLVIPLIDFSRFVNGSPDERLSTARAMFQGFESAGFIYLKNHPIPADVLSRIFSRSADFFALPTAEKQVLGWTTPQANRGYSALGREKTSMKLDADQIAEERDSVPDLKESLEIGREAHPVHENRWPEEGEGKLKGFRDDMLGFYNRCRDVGCQLMTAIALAMGLEADFFQPFIDASDNQLRLLHYPEVDVDVFKSKPGQVRAGEHTDYGSITLLFQDDRGGLQVKSPTGNFVNATPIQGTIVVNAGDLLARWSNDHIKSTLHRVVEPPRNEGKKYPSRYSIAYFCNPNFDSIIETIPGTYAGEEDKKYEGVRSGDWVSMRLAATY
ncbi:thymine dioxygenase [Ophiocordyceps camponoti-floridani]|uniref:Thymine dioxygenase n=1 Tax=Ophiocordyceps camponoti-floridani TaxID=2030778 RepID=A0A8H4VCJ4_9HYPO|nr:thymine dioxygenase [Ophiocordyceps camponoti-floridani]